MNKELKTHINKLQMRATLSLIAILSAIILIGFGILLLFIPSVASILFFAIAAVSILYLIGSARSAKKEAKENNGKPVVFQAEKDSSFDEIVTVFENLTDQENRLSISEDVRFFQLDKVIKLRAILYKTVDFHKKDFDSAKARMNKKANRKLNISQWVSQADAHKMMRFNIIFTDALNDELYRFISQNAARNLTRIEGVINIAIAGDQIMLQPLYGECDLAEISRYKGVIKFINETLLSIKAG